MLIDPDKLVRDRAARWEALDSVRLPAGRGKDGRSVAANVLKSVLRFIESKEGNNGKEWHSLSHMAEIMGLKGTKTLERALYALRMMGLLSINDTSRGGKRCLEKSINWLRVFRDEPIVQAAEGGRQKAEQEFTTEARRNGDEQTRLNENTAGVPAGALGWSDVVSDGSAGGNDAQRPAMPNRAIPFGSASVPRCLRGESLNSDTNDSDTTTRGFRHSVGTDSDTNAPQTGPECRNPTICSIIKQTSIQTSIQTSTEPGEWMGGDFDDFKREEDFTTEAPRHGEETCQAMNGMTAVAAPTTSLIGVNTLVKAGESSAPTGTAMIQSMAPTTARSRGVPIATEQAAGANSVPPCLRGESHTAPDSRPPTPDSPMASRVIHPGERDLIARLVSLGVSAAQVTVRHAFRAGYSVEQITSILDWYEGHGLADPSNPGQKVFPYAPGQLVRRLQDPYGIVDRAGQTLDPALGNWAGGKYGVWTSLKAQAVAAAKLAVPPKPAALVAAVPDESKAEIDKQIDSLSHAEALELLEPGSIVRTVAQRKWLPGSPMPGLVRTALRAKLR